MNALKTLKTLLDSHVSRFGFDVCMHKPCEKQFRKVRSVQWFCSDVCRKAHITERAKDNPLLVALL